MRRTVRRFKRYGRSSRRRSGAKRGIYHFKRYATSQTGGYTIVGAAPYTPYQGANTFQLSDIAGLSDFANLFDSYRINKVVVRWYLKIDPSAQVAASATFPKLYSVVDNDDIGIISQSVMREHPNCKIQVMNPNRPVSRILRPAAQGAVYQPVTNTYTPKWKQWIDMAATGCPHYGLKWNIDDLSNTNYRVDVECIYYFSVRHVR